MSAFPRYGRIVQAWVNDPQGRNRKRRNLVIVSSTVTIQSNLPIVAVAISGQFQNLQPSQYVELPWQAQGFCLTKLTKRCAAICHWIEKLSLADIVAYGGIVPDHLMDEIIKRLSVALRSQLAQGPPTTTTPPATQPPPTP